MLLYDSPSPAPNPRRVRIYLAEKGLTVPTKSLSVMAGEHKSPEFVAKYPPGQLPVLELDDGRMIGETIAICRYFEALHRDPPMFGTEAISVAEIEMWIRRVELNFGAAIRNIWIHTHPLTARVVKHQYTDFGESNRPLAETAMRSFDKALSKTVFLAGDRYSMADIALLSSLDFAAFIGVPIPDDAPALRDWHARVSARPSASA
ncbi:MAG TPA: glutathione S-transferase family protein [Sphingorhabdus sp.]|jgi:glutathione S-transferase|nr:glutathione S-transferase family protein [Sphingorhabdus sp.]